MRLLLDTSTPVCKLTLIDGEHSFEAEWQANRNLADGLIGYIRGQLAQRDKKWTDIDSIAVYKGPGSFTGLRIGLTVMNTLAEELNIPIVGESGEAWATHALERLDSGVNDRLVMPLYGREANITKPRK